VYACYYLPCERLAPLVRCDDENFRASNAGPSSLVLSAGPAIKIGGQMRSALAMPRFGVSTRSSIRTARSVCWLTAADHCEGQAAARPVGRAR